MHPPHYQSPAHKAYTIKLLEANPLLRDLTPEEKAEQAEMAAALGRPDPDHDDYVTLLRRADAILKSGDSEAYFRVIDEEPELYPYLVKCSWLANERLNVKR